MRAVVTGAAGFIGSTLCDALLSGGHEVLAVDCFTPYYDTDVKRTNAAGFTVVEADLRHADLHEWLAATDVVFHLAAQPGVRSSWADGFETYDSHNVLATQRLLEAAADRRVHRLVVASSSSVYGDVPHPVHEDAPLAPRSPYGVTKAAAEHLVGAYAAARGLETVILRLFTVYGPRQRPDMLIHRLIESALGGPACPLYGDGSQSRDFTYVDDVVSALLLSASADVERGATFNIAGGTCAPLSAVIDMVRDCVGQAPLLDRQGVQRGDVVSTRAVTEKARRALGWAPAVDLRQGIAAQVEWHLRQRTAA